MITRLSEIIPQLTERFRERGWPVRQRKDVFLEAEAGEKTLVIDGMERTGPIYWPNLSPWIKRCGDGQLILLTMGFFPKEALGEFLKTGLARRVALIELGLASFFETEPRPRKLGRVDTEPFQVVEEVLAGEGIKPELITCRYCREAPVVGCEECGNLICKSHFISCPLCRAKLCHPDVADCYFKHNC